MSVAVLLGLLVTGDGTSAPLDTGEVRVVNLWASWCGPCRAELPLLDALHASIDAEGAEVLAVSVDDSVPRAKALVRHLSLDLPVRYGGQPLAEALAPTALPATYVLDREGNVRFVHTGELDAADIEEISTEVRGLVAESL